MAQDRNLAIQRLEHELVSGGQSAADTIRHVQENVPEDFILPATSFHWSGVEKLMLRPTPNAPERPITGYALGQAAARVGFPGGYARDVIQERGAIGVNVVAQALNTLYQTSDPHNLLLRSVLGRWHAVLSDKFRRIDSRPMVDAFIGAALRAGARPIEGIVTDTRISIKVVLPEIIVLSTGDLIVLGEQFENSDFGAGKYRQSAYVTRIICWNGMIGTELFSKAHLGGRLSEDFEFSTRTYELDTRAFASATNDLVKGVLGPAGRERTIAAIEKSLTEKIDVDSAMAHMKKGLSKKELALVTEALQSVDEAVMPMGPPSPYRMANALGWVAQHAEDGDRKLEIQKMAGEWLNPFLDQKAA